MNTSDNYSLFRILRILFITIVTIMAMLYLIPQLQIFWSNIDAVPRVVKARGELSGAEQTNIDIFRQASPSVVYITTITEAVNLWTRDITRIPKGTGSGFIWDKHGHIITNYHVLQGATAIRIQLNDKRIFSARLVGASPDHDIAVLRIPPLADLPQPIPIGTSHDLQVGQMTYAIGNPFGLDRTLTTGVVSALDRSLYNDNGSVIKGLIQTDAAINPGNSGGPLLDSAGRLIGINTAIYSPSGTFAGIGFTVPVDTVNRIVPKIISQGNYRRPRLGITIDDEMNKELTSQLNVQGVAVIDVQAGSPASHAGLKGITVSYSNSIIPGDIILSIDQKKTTNTKELLESLEAYALGDIVSVTYLRNGREERASIKLN